MIKNEEKNNKILEVKFRKEGSIIYTNKKKKISEAEKKLLMVYYSYLKNVS
jgi:hypothetical protein